MCGGGLRCKALVRGLRKDCGCADGAGLRVWSEDRRGTVGVGAPFSAGLSTFLGKSSVQGYQYICQGWMLKEWSKPLVSGLLMGSGDCRRVQSGALQGGAVGVEREV